MFILVKTKTHKQTADFIIHHPPTHITTHHYQKKYILNTPMSVTNTETFSWFQLTHQSCFICDCRPLCVIPRTKCKRNRLLFFLNYFHTEFCTFQTYRFLNLLTFYRLIFRTWNSILRWALQNYYFKIPKGPVLQCFNIFT